MKPPASARLEVKHIIIDLERKTMYKLTNIEIKLIESPIILIMPPDADGADSSDTQQNIFNNGSELAEKNFTCKYDINTVRAREDGMIEVILTLPEVERAQVKDETANNSAGSVSFF